VSEGFRTVAIAAFAIAAGFTWQSLRTSAIAATSAERLVAELRLAQMAALLMTLVAGVYVGLAVAHEARMGTGLDIAFAIGFLIVAGYTMVLDPRHALPVLALGFAALAVLSVAHRPGLLPDDLAPRWYTIGVAIFDVYIGALCYWPMLRRP
jgi:hypothetical protein